MTVRLILSLLFGLFIYLLPANIYAQKNAQVPDPDPELERKSFQLAEGFEVNLFAADPLLAKPIQMNFDAQGRLWVASSEVYPHIKPGQKANDKIIVLEDVDGDGKADKTTVFADGLLIPTGIEPGDGGAYVGNSTELVHLKASKPGQKADQRRIVLSGFGTEDTHHIVHTLRWGPDGMLYFNQSIYIHSHIETPYGVKTLNGGGIWSLRPENLDLNVFVRGFVNTWGHHFDDYGQSFITDGAYGEGINHGVPGAYYVTAVGASRILHGMNPGSPKHCGLEILSGSHLPEDWRGNILTNDFRGHRVCRFVIQEDGSTFSAVEKQELIRTNHPAFRPIDIKMGPDGAIYIADWYNPIIQHGEIDFRDPRRDHTHGRIWRVTAKGRPLVKRPDLIHATNEQLLQNYHSSEYWTRHQSRRVLKERGAEKIVPALQKWIKELKLHPEQKDYEHLLLEGLWTSQSVDRVDHQLLKELLKAKDGKIRAAAVRVLSYVQNSLPEHLSLFQAAVNDPHPRVRLEAICALAKSADLQAESIALQALDHPMDSTLDYSLWLTTRELQSIWVKAFQEGKIDLNRNPEHISFAFNSLGIRTDTKPLFELLKNPNLSENQSIAIYQLIALRGSPADWQKVLDVVFQKAKQNSFALKLLQSLEEVTRQNRQIPTGDLKRLKEFFAHQDDKIGPLAILLAGRWKVSSLRNDLIEIAKQSKFEITVRSSAIQALSEMNDRESIQTLLTLLEDTQNPGIQRIALASLIPVALESTKSKLVPVLSKLKPTDNPEQIFTLIMQQKQGPKILLSSLQNAKLPQDIAKIGLRIVRSSGQKNDSLQQALTRAGNLGQSAYKLTPEQVKEMTSEIIKNGNPAHGEQLYRSKELRCIECHALGGAGGAVGPELASIGASAPVDYLLESIIYPNKAVKEGYHSLRIATVNGQIFTGIKIRENTTELVIRTFDDKEIKIPIDDIESRGESASLMPEGLADSLTRQELIDLVRFLSELGKVGPYSLSKGRIIRHWEVLLPNSNTIRFFQQNRVGTVANPRPFFEWQTLLTEVSGMLPIKQLPSFTIFNQTRRMSVVRAKVNVTTAGKVKIKSNIGKGINLYIGPNSIALTNEGVVDLPKGLQTLTFTIDLPEVKDFLNSGLIIELDDAPNSAARFTILNGKW